MKLEKLGRNRKKKIAIGVVVFLCFISATIYTGSRAKYKVTQSIPLVNGTINYKPYDFKMMAMYQGDGSGRYTEVSSMPTSGYKINEEKSYCTIDNINKDTTAKLFTNSQGQHVIENLKKNDKCYIWFDKESNSKITLDMLGLTATTGATSFSAASTSNEGLKSGEDDDGTTYYFRGNVTNNWVSFAGFYWRIIRINGDGSIRMIYNGKSTTTTGTSTQIGTSAYNSSSNDNAYIGYMYGSAGSSTYTTTHANTNNSTIKTAVDNWYKTNIIDKGYSNKISSDAGFCNDRSIASSSETWWDNDTKKGYGTNRTAYGPWSRTSTSSGSYNSTQTPSFRCTNASADLFTVSSSSKGNKKLTYPVGLITADEVIFGGGFGDSSAISHSGYFLYTNQSYWTVSPSHFPGGITQVFMVSSSGSLWEWAVNLSEPGVRPVINLSSDVKLSGSGTTSDPYKVV